MQHGADDDDGRTLGWRLVFGLASIAVAAFLAAVVLSGCSGKPGGGKAPAAPAAAEEQPDAPPGLRFTPPPAAPEAVPETGNFGYVPNPEATERFIRSLPDGRRTLREAAPGLFERGPPDRADDEPVLLYRALLEAHQKHLGKPFVVGSQGIGDCVSWGYGHGCDVELAIQWKLGKSGSWINAATEAIYGGSRVEGRGKSEGSGGYSDGSYGAAATAWLHERGGVVYRRDYADFGINLTVYDSKRAKAWGNWGNGGQGDGGKFDAEARKHPIQTVALVATFDEAAAAIRSGYPVPVCSGQGFSSTRDADGFCRPSGSWSHCMCFVGWRGAPRPGLLCLNSWGPNWVRGPKFPDDQPDGSFWVDRATADKMLRGRDSFALSATTAFERRKLRLKEGWANGQKDAGDGVVGAVRREHGGGRGEGDGGSGSSNRPAILVRAATDPVRRKRRGHGRCPAGLAA